MNLPNLLPTLMKTRRMLRTVNLKCSRHFYPRGSDGNEGSEEHVGPDGPVTDSTCGQYHHDNHPD